jgi:predicted GIY-YIG superfamily endonuclease
MATLYLLHLDRKFHGRAGHYVGYTARLLELRLRDHGTRRGARLLHLARQEGIGFRVALTEEHPDANAARQRERRLKREGHLDRHCGVCRGTLETATKAEEGKEGRG